MFLALKFPKHFTILIDTLMKLKLYGVNVCHKVLNYSMLENRVKISFENFFCAIRINTVRKS